MSNHSLCIFILTQLIGFEKSDNGERITLPDQVEIDTLIRFKRDFFQDNNVESTLNHELSPSHQMKMVDKNELFWGCHHCTYHNPIDSNTCQMCTLPRNVCINPVEYSILINNYTYVLFV